MFVMGQLLKSMIDLHLCWWWLWVVGGDLLQRLDLIGGLIFLF